MSGLAGRQQRTGLFFTLPWLIGLSVFMAYPVMAALYYSLCNYSVLLPPVFIGFDNYVELVFDELFLAELMEHDLLCPGFGGVGHCYEPWPSPVVKLSGQRSGDVSYDLFLA